MKVKFALIYLAGLVGYACRKAKKFNVIGELEGGYAWHVLRTL